MPPPISYVPPRVVDGHTLLEKFCAEEGLHDDQNEDHQSLGWNDAVVTSDTLVIDFNHMTKYLDPEPSKRCNNAE